ncbi:MAG: hypothetical protein AB8E15_03245 [Bdellovibrionales bacterium]
MDLLAKIIEQTGLPESYVRDCFFADLRELGLGHLTEEAITMDVVQKVLMFQLEKSQIQMPALESESYCH